MLAVGKYTQEYVDRCRARFDSWGDAGDDLLALESNALALDRMFVHRLRKGEAKNGACKEMRALAESILEGDDPPALDRAGLAKLADAYFAEIEASFLEG